MHPHHGVRTNAKRGGSGGAAGATSNQRRGAGPAKAGSCPSSPVRHSPTSAISSRLRANSPSSSSDGDWGKVPVRGSSPQLGLKPYTPQIEAGRSTEPLVCVPTATGTTPAATAAEPLEDPPGRELGVIPNR